MKAGLLSISFFFALRLFSQIVCAGISPASIAGNYDFSWAQPPNGWGSPDFNIPGTNVSGELMLVDDGTPGINPITGVPLAHYGCNPLLNDLSGKIAFVYRYDGVTPSTLCFLYDKALVAQNAGAIAVVIVNRPGGPEDVGGGGTVGPGVNIPVVLISFSDGENLREEMANGAVSMFLGNKTGLYNNDIGLSSQSRLISKNFGVLSSLSQNGFGFDLGARIYNYGTNNQSTIYLNASIEDDLGTSLYNQNIGPFSLNGGDSIDVAPGEALNFPPFTVASINAGKYTLRYSATLGIADDFLGDNAVESSFIVNDTILSYARLDSQTLKPIATNAYRPSAGGATYSVCMAFEHPLLSSVSGEGIYFSAITPYNSGVSLEGEEMSVMIYRWDDVFTDLNDANLGFDNLTQVGFGYYTYPADLQNQVVYAPFDNIVPFVFNQRYLGCVQTFNPDVYLGHDNKTNYLWNEAHYLQPIAPNESGGTFYPSGFGMDIPSSIALKVCNSCTESILENSNDQFDAYPNPFQDQLSLSTKSSDHITHVTITDIRGNIVSSIQFDKLETTQVLDVSQIESGLYILEIISDSGRVFQKKILKK
jgi:hypothetical protein